MSPGATNQHASSPAAMPAMPCLSPNLPSPLCGLPPAVPPPSCAQPRVHDDLRSGHDGELLHSLGQPRSGHASEPVGSAAMRRGGLGLLRSGGRRGGGGLGCIRSWRSCKPAHQLVPPRHPRTAERREGGRKFTLKVLYTQNSITLIEWPQIIEEKPKNLIELNFRYEDNHKKRSVQIRGLD